MRSIQSPSLHFPKAYLILILSRTFKSLIVTSMFFSWSVGFMPTLHQCPWKFRSNSLNSLFSKSSLCTKVIKRTSIQILQHLVHSDHVRKYVTYCTSPWGHSTSFISKLHNSLYQWPSQTSLTNHTINNRPSTETLIDITWRIKELGNKGTKIIIWY